jgi:hypothetical protein
MRELPPVATINGAMLEDHSPSKKLVMIQYQSQTGELCQLEMPLDAALRLLTFLREIEKDQH